MISVSGLEMSFGDRVLFAGATFQLNAGERYGLVGANGSGKTTLLNILAGDIEPTEGTVSLPKQLRLGVLRQDQFLYEDESTLGVTLMGNPTLWNAMVEKETLLAAAHETFDMERFSELEETIQAHDGYTAESRASEILEGLGIPGAVHRNPIRTLSGGFKLRVLLAQVLASKPDVLLLDEPTNHLDILSIRWLERFLCEFKGPVVVISHDHRFLDNIATHIIDLDYETAELYTGDYTRFVVSKVTERERREKEIAGRERAIAHHQKFVDRFKAKASKARQAQSKVRMIERQAEEIRPLPMSSRRYPTFRFDQRRESGRDVLKLKGVRKAFADREVLHGVDLIVQKKDRLAIMGPNGIGKSTLLKIAMGELAPDTGTSEWGYEAHPGYFAQDHRNQFDSATGTAEEWIWKVCPDKDLGFVRGRLALMLFTGDDPKKRLDNLSGGEAARLVFSRISMERPNVLVLDEPTNHLDLESIEALVEGLKKFEGTLIFVSHDRWFVGELATRIVEILPSGIRDYRGTYEEYVHSCGDDHLDADRVISQAKDAKRSLREAKASSRGGRGGASPAEPKSGNARSGNAKSGKAKDGNAKDGNAKSGHAKSDGPKQRRQDPEEIAGRVEQSEARIREIDELFCTPDFFGQTPKAEIQFLERERAELQRVVAELLAQWEELEAETSPHAARPE